MALVLEYPLLGHLKPLVAACARSAAVCESIVWSFFCRAEDTRAYIAALVTRRPPSFGPARTRARRWGTSSA